MPSKPATSIDLRQIAPPARHVLIFNTFDALAPGESLELVNDHDPLPLHAQFGLRTPGQFNWNYLENGPAVWRVQIDKTTKTIKVGSDSCCGSCGGA